MRTKAFLFLTFLLFNTVSCNQNAKEKSNRLYIIATTNIVADAVKQIVGERAEVISLMGAGVDPHLYKVSQGDIQKLSEADIIVSNGLHLEGRMNEVFDRLQNKTIIKLSDGAEPDKLLQINQQNYDPHFWFDVMIWKSAIIYLSKQLMSIDTANAEFYQNNTKQYITKLDILHHWINEQYSKVVPQKRILITAHDAFSYYGKAYQLEVLSLQGISTLSDFGLNDIDRLTHTITSRKVKSIFVETSISSKTIESIVENCNRKNHLVSIGGSLYSDALGTSDSETGTYIGMLKYNTQTIAQAIK
ncbi:MAG: manganese transporter [Cytophagales bacterium]|nr:MAG: manganese transporter [Cytophagales bacterium]